MITVVGLIAFLIKIMNDEKLERFAEEMHKKRQNDYRKPKQEDITDI